MLYDFLNEIQYAEFERLETRQKKIKAGKPIGVVSGDNNVWASESFPSLGGNDKGSERIRQLNQKAQMQQAKLYNKQSCFQTNFPVETIELDNVKARFKQLHYQIL